MKKKKDVPLEFGARLRMRDKMETEDAHRIYAMRKITVEPVIGQIKENFGFRQFCLRGIEGAKIEINIVCIVHNLKKIWKGMEEREKITRNLKEDHDKKFVLEILIDFYIEINLIVRQRPLLGVLNEVKARRAWSERSGEVVGHCVFILPNTPQLAVGMKAKER